VHVTRPRRSPAGPQFPAIGQIQGRCLQRSSSCTRSSCVFAMRDCAFAMRALYSAKAASRRRCRSSASCAYTLMADSASGIATAAAKAIQIKSRFKFFINQAT